MKKLYFAIFALFFAAFNICAELGQAQSSDQAQTAQAQGLSQSLLSQAAEEPKVFCVKIIKEKIDCPMEEGSAELKMKESNASYVTDQAVFGKAQTDQSQSQSLLSQAAEEKTCAKMVTIPIACP